MPSGGRVDRVTRAPTQAASRCADKAPQRPVRHVATQEGPRGPDGVRGPSCVPRGPVPRVSAAVESRRSNGMP